MELNQIRQDIDAIDIQLVHLLEERMALVEKVSYYKAQNAHSTLDKNREQVILDNVSQRVINKEFVPYLQQNFKDIMAVSRQYQEDQK